MKKAIIIVLALALLAGGAFWAKNYYNERYVASDVFYTQIPTDEVNEDSWLADADGVQQEKGKSYALVGYNEAGEPREVNFIKRGTAENYYAPGAYIKVSASKTLVVGVELVAESDVPQAALEKISTLGTKIQ